MPQLSYFKVLGTWEPSSPKGVINGDVTFTMLIQNNGVLAAPTLDNPAVVVPTVVHTVIDNNTLQPVSLLANTAALNLTGTLYYTATFSDVSYREPGKPEAGLTIGPITFAASPDTTSIDLVFVTPAAGSLATQTVLPSTLAAYITDATTLGRELLTAPDAATALSDLGLGGLQTNLGLASTALQPSAVVNNSDGTLSVTGVNSLEPLSTVTILTASTAPAVGQTTYYNATSGNLTPPLPALSGLRVGARLAVRRDPADVSQNTVTLTCAGLDTFYSSGGTTATLPMSGEQREYQVVSVASTKYWAPAGSLNPVAALDTRYLAGASKLVSIGDQGWAGSQNGFSTSAAGTSEMKFIIGQPATGLSALFTHFHSLAASDIEPSGPITFNASLKVVSSTNAGTTTGVLYRLTFGGRITTTLDPGGKVAADELAISVLPGDVVAVRAYLSSGTAYPPRQVQTATGGFTATTDLTAPGSAAITGPTGYYYGPAALLGRPTGAAGAKSVFVAGDSIAYASVDTTTITMTQLGNGGPILRALSGNAGILNAAVSGELSNQFYLTGGSFHRLGFAAFCNSAIIEYGTNDLNSGVYTAAQVETSNLLIATYARRQGVAKVFFTTLLPRTSSTDYWATTTNQTPLTGEAQRVAYNTWVRAGCPVNATTLAPVSVGVSGALLAGQFGHPVTGFFDTAAQVETSLNSGLWLAARRVITGSMTAGSVGGVNNVINSATSTFIAGNQEAGGDVGLTIYVPGAGVSGAVLGPTFGTFVADSAHLWLAGVASTSVTNAQIVMGTVTNEGVHPSGIGSVLMAQAINPAML